MMRGARKTLPFLAIIAVIAAGSVNAVAGPPDASDAANKKDGAIVHFDKGLALYDRGAWAPALAEFIEARRLYPLRNAIYQAGLCLEKLQRYDEALDRFEAALREFGDGMPAQVKENVQRKVLEMRGLVGEIVILGAEPGATVTVDGIGRGEHPLLVPLRVAAGSHLMKVEKLGFEPLVIRVDVAGGKTERVAARLKPVAPSGRARISEQTGKALEVLVDGAPVGKTTWEGPLATGEHVVMLRGEGKLGTPPVGISIELNRTTQLTLAAEKLAAALRVEPVPKNASVAIDGVTVGRGVWEGRLRAGTHRVELAAPGFLAETRRVDIGEDRKEVVRAVLSRDESSPFWRKPSRPSRFLVEADTSVVLIPGSSSTAYVAGGASVLHAGYELGMGLGFGISAGYWGMISGNFSASESLEPVGLPNDRGTVSTHFALRCGLAGAWLGFSLGERFRLHFRLGAGALVGTVLAELTGRFQSSTFPEKYDVGPAIERNRASFFWLTPEVRLGLPIGRHIEVNVGVKASSLLAIQQPVWVDWTFVHAGSAGIGLLPEMTLVPPVTVAVASGIGARYNF